MTNITYTAVKYTVPEDETILAFAGEICEGFADHYEDDSYAEKEIIYGLSSFMKVVLRIEAKHRNLTAISNRCTVDNDKADDKVLDTPRHPGHSTNAASAMTSDRLYHVGGLSATDCIIS